MIVDEFSDRGIVVWAVDPFQPEVKPDWVSVNVLKEWIHGAGFLIQPIYVLSNSYSDENSAPELAVDRYLKDLGVTEFLPPKVLFEYSNSLREAAHLLLDYLEDLRYSGSQNPAKLIVVSSKGRSGLGRMVFGSFSETLIAKSNLPILFLTHLSDRDYSSKTHRALFATDFSEISRNAFELFVSQADFQSICNEIILYHEVAFPVLAASGLSAGGVAWIPEDYLKEQKEWANYEAASWKRRAEMKGLRLRSIVLENVQGVAQSILDLARKENVGLIAMASQSTAITKVMVGSVAQEVFRSNEFPVWVCGPQTKNV